MYGSWLDLVVSMVPCADHNGACDAISCRASFLDDASRPIVSFGVVLQEYHISNFKLDEIGMFCNVALVIVLHFEDELGLESTINGVDASLTFQISIDNVSSGDILCVVVADRWQLGEWFQGEEMSWSFHFSVDGKQRSAVETTFDLSENGVQFKWRDILLAKGYGGESRFD